MNIHLIGIGGVGMAGLAVLLKNRGHAVSGCDVHLGARTRWLESLGIRVTEGHDPKHVENADMVIVTPAVHTDNPELLAARNVRYRGEVLAELVSEATDSIAVCGSHGKTTTATWIAKLLIALGENVEWAIGGETGTFSVAGEVKVKGEGEHSPSPTVLVVEADESDGTLAKYHARTLVVTNCEYDHPDHFKTRADYFACYEAAKQNAGEVIEGEKVGNGEKVERWGWSEVLPEHNRKNARTAIEVALRRGHTLDSILAAMSVIVKELPDRRFQKIADGVYTDYAHHPTEMACAVQMARAICRDKLRVLFQPHRYSRTKALLADFPKAFADADEVVLCPTYAAFENPIEGGDIADLYKVCREDGGLVLLAQSCDEAWEHACNSMKPGDLTLLLGAGDIINLVPKIQRDLRLPTRLPTNKQTRIWIGEGLNTRKSDLKRVFKNPSGDYAGRLLEAAGCKGLRVGGAHVWEEHANVIVADANATNSDFLALARLMYNRVYFRLGIRLEPEISGLVVGFERGLQHSRAAENHGGCDA